VTSRVARGAIVLVAGGVYASKPRPAIVVQDDLFDGTSSLTVCPLTTVDVQAPLLRMEIPAEKETGLDTTSYAMVDKLTTVRRTHLGTVLGDLNAVLMLELERRLLVFLGIAR